MADEPLPAAMELSRARSASSAIEAAWQEGGIRLLFCVSDTVVSKPANDTLAAFVRERIRDIVKDPAVAERLLPRDYPLGTKRLCVDTDYFATYNRPNVTLVDLRSTPIVRATPHGLSTSGADFPARQHRVRHGIRCDDRRPSRHRHTRTRRTAACGRMARGPARLSRTGAPRASRICS